MLLSFLRRSSPQLRFSHEVGGARCVSPGSTWRAGGVRFGGIGPERSRRAGNPGGDRRRQAGRRRNRASRLHDPCWFLRIPPALPSPEARSLLLTTKSMARDTRRWCTKGRFRGSQIRFTLGKLT
jgi:hypothetical protein